MPNHEIEPNKAPEKTEGKAPEAAGDVIETGTPGPEMENIKLDVAAEDIATMQEIEDESHAISDTMKTAMKIGQESFLELEKRRQQFWADMGEKHGFGGDDDVSINREDAILTITREKPAEAEEKTEAEGE